MFQISSLLEPVNMPVVASNWGRLEVRGAEYYEAEEVKNYNRFGFEVIEKPIYLQTGQRVKGYKSVLRNDNFEVLNVCKESYTPVSNEMFCEFVSKVETVTGYSAKEFTEFENGKKVLAFLKAPETRLNGWQFKNFMVIGNSHDSSKSFFVANTSVMIRCQNQFTALSDGALKAFHSSGVNSNIKEIERSIHLYNVQQNTIEQNYNKMLASPVNAKRIENFTANLFDIEQGTPEISTRKQNQVEQFAYCLAKELNELGKNDFALFNAVTRYTTHHRNQKDKCFGNLFGTNALLNNKAIKFLLS